MNSIKLLVVVLSQDAMLLPGTRRFSFLMGLVDLFSETLAEAILEF